MNGPSTRDQRPCDNCRRRKTRCLFASEEANNCVLCMSRSTECTYIQDAPLKKRPRVMSATSQSISSRPTQRFKSASAATPVDYSTLQGKTMLKETLGHQNRQSSSVIGETSDFDISIVRSLAHDLKGECLSLREPSVLRRPSESVYFRMRPDTQEEMEQELRDLDAVESVVAPYGTELVNLYFRIVHPSFPVLNKQVFLEKHGRSYRESTPTGLGAVYILALNWWSYSPSLSSKPKPNARKLEKLVLRMLFNVHQRPKISDLQGGLVLLQQPGAGSWALTGQLVAMSQNLGIHLDCTGWQIPEWERSVRKRVAWGIFMQDKWGALIYGRPSNINMEDWEVTPLQNSDFPETSADDTDEEGSADTEKGRQTFLQMVLLTQIVTDILSQFLTRSALRRKEDLRITLERARSLQKRLADWFSNLPPTLSIDDTTPRRLSSVGYLHLAFHTAEITLYRAILRCQTHLSSDQSTTLDSDLLVKTRATASARLTSALSFVKKLNHSHLQSFWYFSSSTSFSILGVFASVLAISSADDEERRGHVALLAELRWVLRISSVGAEVMRGAVSVLDAVAGVLERNVLDREGDGSVIDGENISPYAAADVASPAEEAWLQAGAFDGFEYGAAFLGDTHMDTYAMNDMYAFDTVGS